MPPALSCLDFNRVLAMRKLAKLHIPASQDRFLPLIWAFLGRCQDVICVPQDIARLEHAIEAAQKRISQGLQVTVLLKFGMYRVQHEIIIPPSLSLIGDAASAGLVTIEAPRICLGSGPLKPRGGKLVVKNITLLHAVDHVQADLQHRGRRGVHGLRKRTFEPASDSTSELKRHPSMLIRYPAVVEQCLIKGGWVGIDVAKSGQGTCIRRSEVSGASLIGITVHGSASVLDCILNKCGLGIHVKNVGPAREAKGCLIRGNCFNGHAMPVQSDASNKSDGILVDQKASAEIAWNNFCDCTNSIVLKDVQRVNVESNIMTASQEVALSIKEHWYSVTAVKNEIVGCQWGVLCCKQGRNFCGGGEKLLLVADNQIRRAQVFAITVFGARFGAGLQIQVSNNDLQDNNAGVNISGRALKSRFGLLTAPFNASVAKNVITGCHREAVRISRGAAAHVVSNIINKNGRGIFVEDSILGACRALLEANSFDTNNGWAIRFALIMHVGRCQEAYRNYLLMRMQSMNLVDYKQFLVLALAPQLKARVGERLKDQIYESLVSLDVDVLLSLLTNKESLIEFARKFDDTLWRHGVPEIEMGAIDSVVKNNVIISSDRYCGLGIRIDTILQKPFIQENLNQDGVMVVPKLAKDGVQLSTSHPRWLTLSQCIECFQKRISSQFALESGELQIKHLKMRKGLAQNLRSKTSCDLEAILGSEDDQLRLISEAFNLKLHDESDNSKDDSDEDADSM